MTTDFHTQQLDGGQILAYTEYGDPAGVPIFYCHGLPGSRTEAALADDPRSLGVRLIAVDRPGYGHSPHQPGRSIAQWPRLIAALAERLDIGRFRVLGVSGGGPYAMACAHELGDRVERLGLVCGLGELVAPDAMAGMNPLAALGLKSYRSTPDLVGSVYRYLLGPAIGLQPGWILKAIATYADPADRQVLADPEVQAVLVASMGEAFRQGGLGAILDVDLLTRPWPFRAQDIAVPTLLWHGEADRTVPAAMGRRHAELIPDCQARFIADEGHFSLVVRYAAEVLRALARE